MTDESQEQVTQADRDAAADYLIAAYPEAVRDERVSAIRRGKKDNDPAPQAFARHRLTHTEPQDASRPSEPSQSMETWESINQWCDDTFGKANIPAIIKRAKEEFDELEEPDADHAIEAADVVICLCRIPGFAEALQRKMAINRKRKWKTDGKGTGYHIPEALRTQEARPLHRCPTSNDPDLEGPRTARPEAVEAPFDKQDCVKCGTNRHAIELCLDCQNKFFATLSEQPRTDASDLRELLARLTHENGPICVDQMGDGLAWRPLDHGTWQALGEGR